MPACPQCHPHLENFLDKEFAVFSLRGRGIGRRVSLINTTFLKINIFSDNAELLKHCALAAGQMEADLTSELRTSCNRWCSSFNFLSLATCRKPHFERITYTLQMSVHTYTYICTLVIPNYKLHSSLQTAMKGAYHTSPLEDPGVPHTNGMEVQREMSCFRALILPVKAKPSHKKQK